MSSDRQHCKEIQEWIEPYVDGELGPEELERCERHLAECPACAQEVELARAVASELRALPIVEAPERVVSAAAREAFNPSWWQRALDGLAERLSPTRVPAMAAMILVVAAAGVFVLTQRDRTERVNGYTQAEIDEARREATLAFAYINKYTRRASRIVREEVIDEGMNPAFRRALSESGNAIDKGMMPQVRMTVEEMGVSEEQTKTKSETNDPLKRSDE